VTVTGTFVADPTPEPEVVIDRGSGFLPIVVRLMGGIIAQYILAARGHDEDLPQLRADIQALRELNIDMTIPHWLTDATRTQLVEYQMKTMELPPTALLQATFDLAATLDLELLDLPDSRAGTHP
jgi:hypothetical protein